MVVLQVIVRATRTQNVLGEFSCFTADQLHCVMVARYVPTYNPLQELTSTALRSIS